MAEEKAFRDDEVLRSISSPEQLARIQDKMKVTITLSSITVDFFKREAAKHGTKYQRLIRAVLDEYVGHYASRDRERSPNG